MQIQFQLSFDDYLAAQRLHAKRNLWQLGIYALNHYLFPVIGICSLVLSIPLMGSKVQDHSGLIMIFCGVILTGYPFYMRWKLKQCYKRTRIDDGESKIVFDEARIRVEARHASSEMDWDGVKSHFENGKVIMLYLAPAKFIVVPKRVCTDEQIAELHALLLRLVGPVLQS